MANKTYSYLNPAIEMRALQKKGHFGLFAVQVIPAGTLLTMWGGRVVNSKEYQRLTPFMRTHGLQIEDDLFQVPLCEDDPADFFNHSCNPNAGFNNPISLVAMREICEGEEICFDYAMSEDNHFDEFKCACGTNCCRGEVTGKDWQIAELQKRYFGYFSPYLQRRINAKSIADTPVSDCA